jgi:hypothetical protein
VLDADGCHSGTNQGKDARRLKPPEIEVKRVRGNAALHSNLHKEYAAASAKLKKAAVQKYAKNLSSYVMQRAVTTALIRAKTLIATSNPK